ncbi:MAG TPA: HAD family hydrolase [Candidatus Sulfotelmatobacter sp.]|nr:HAD family hydrolase [Candidatus Sulfotelmatobacter sp.]
MTQIKAILFDMFDTLMMIEKGHAYYSPSIRETYNFLVDKGIAVNFEEFYKEYIEVTDRLYAATETELNEPHFNERIAGTLKQLGYDYDVSNPIVIGATNAFCERFMTYVKIDEYAERILQELHGQYKLGIVSNFAIPECVIRLIQRQGLEKLFDIIIVSGAVNKRKPHPEIYKKALQALKIDPREAIFVGDTVDADVQGAKTVGMKTIYVERRLQKDVEIACPTQTIKSLDQLPLAIEHC